MKISENARPRMFQVGGVGGITISDCGKIFLSPDEQITFVTPSGKNYDFTAKSWGFYASPSVNDRLAREGFKTALVKNQSGKHFIMVVETGSLTDFEIYLNTDKSEVVEWLDER